MKQLHRRCKSCGFKVPVDVWPKELAVRWLYRHRIALEGITLKRGLNRGRRSSWFVLGTLFKALGFYRPMSSAMDIPIVEIVKETRRRLRIGGGCWRDKPRSAWTRERKLAH